MHLGKAKVIKSAWRHLQFIVDTFYTFFFHISYEAKEDWTLNSFLIEVINSLMLIYI